MGSDQALWSDDNLSTKKLFPKFSFPAKSKKWVNRLKTSDQSMLLAIRYLHAKFKARSVEMRSRPDSSVVEDASRKAALAYNLANELCNLVPLRFEQVFQDWCVAWAEGDCNVDTELDSLLLERREDLDPRTHVPSMKKLCDVISRPVVRSHHEESSITQGQFDLVVKQIEYDVQVFTTWEAKKATAMANRDHAAMKWKVDKRQQALAAADTFFESCCRIAPWDKKVEKNIGECMNFRRQVIMNQMGLEHATQIPHICYLNASAPCVLSTVHLKNSVEVMTWALAENMQGVGLVVNPVFSYQKGRILLEERALYDQLMGGNHNLDWGFAIMFGNRQDNRDLRPLVYAGKFVFASPLDVQKNVFWNSELRRLQRTNEVAQLHQRDMREVENLADDALPESTDTTSRVKGASKYSQIGADCCHELLNGLLKGSTYSTIGPALLLIDLHIMTGDMLQAFCKMRASTPHVFYFGLAEDQNEASYVEQWIKNDMADKFLAGTALPNGEKIEASVPDDLLEALPQNPRLNCLFFWTLIRIVFF